MVASPKPVPGTPVVRLQGVSKTYRRHGIPVEALSNVDVVIHPGEFASLKGRSGSGKSTMLHILGMIDSDYEGDYWFDGIMISGRSPDELSTFRNRRIGFVFQSFHLLPQLSILENAALPALYAGDRTTEECHAVAHARLEEMGLSNRLDHRPTELSIGQRQRAAIARALVNNPRLSLADEPTGALDSRTANEILAILQDLHRAGTTLIVVTHDPEVGAAAQRIIHIRDGQTHDGMV
jgi:putative ABC transport system ATP-binding protein